VVDVIELMELVQFAKRDSGESLVNFHALLIVLVVHVEQMVNVLKAV